MKPYFTTIQAKNGSRGVCTHTGKEFRVFLHGILEQNLNGKVYRVKKNENFYFSSQEPHGWLNPGKKKTAVIWVVSPPTFKA